MGGPIAHSAGTGRRARPGRRRTDREPRHGWRPALAIALVVAFVDWGTKAAVVATIPVGELVPVLDGRLAIWHVRNPAMILGLFGDLPLGYRKVMAALLAFTGAILLAEVFTRCQRLLPERRRWAWLFIGLLSGGMLGNLGERILHWWITDFIALGWGDIWLPPGNVADLAIVLSVPVAMLVIVFELEARAHRRPHSSEQEATPQHAETLLPPASY